MTEWKKHWMTFPEGVGPREYLKQVGKTVNGQPISPDQYEMILDSIRGGLALEPSDTVLDLCCGNGLTTHALAGEVGAIVGMDFSEPLLRVANRDHGGANTHYCQRSALDSLAVDELGLTPFNKVYMYEALQHFRRADFETILRNILAVSTEDVTVLLASIPDRRRLWNFYNTPRRRLDFLKRKIRGTEAIGTWWTREYLERVSARLGLRGEYIAQNEMLYTAHYRFNFRITRGMP